MKKFLAAAAVAVALSAAPAHADNVGCGLGAVLLKGNSGMAVNLIATFLNGISANQTFGITTGTSGCTQNGRISGGTGRLFAFMENNLDQFAIDASRGHGETIIMPSRPSWTSPRIRSALSLNRTLPCCSTAKTPMPFPFL